MPARMTANCETRYRIKTLDDAMFLITLLIESKRRMNLAELTAASGMCKNKTFRVLKTLELQGIIDKDKLERYYFGINTFMTARLLLTQTDVPELFRSFLENVAKHLNEEVYLARKTKGQAILMAMANSSQKITIRSYLGCILRDLPLNNVRCWSQVIDGANVSVGSLDQDITTVAVDITSCGEVENAALVVVAPTFRMSPERIRSDVIPVLHETVRQMGLSGFAGRAFHPGTVQGAKKRTAMDHFGTSI